METNDPTRPVEYDVSAPHDNRDPVDDADPTGMRELLRALPDPGPMPAGLVERITASIAREQEQLGSPGSVGAAARDRDGSGDGRGDDELPQIGRRAGRSRRWHYRRTPALVAAAVLAAFLGVGAIVTSGMPDAVVTAVSRGGSDAGGSSGAGSEAHEVDSSAEGTPAVAPPVTAMTKGSDGAAGSADESVVLLTASNRQWTLDSLAASASTLLAGATRDWSSPSATPESDLGLTPVAARACAAALGLADDRGLAVDLGWRGGTPVAAIAALDGAGEIQVAIVDRSCAPGHPGLLDGPRSAD